jgi:hypothetical protein
MIFRGATFHISGHVNSHSCSILGQKWPHEIYEHVRDCLGFNACFGIMRGVEHKYRDRHLPGKVTTVYLSTH